MQPPIYPLGDRLKVLPLVPAEKSKGGIIMPEASEARERPLEGIVLALGRGRALESGMFVELECEVGDVVQFGKYAGIYVFDESVGHDVILMREDEALGRKKRAELEQVEHDVAVRMSAVRMSTTPDRWFHILGDPRCATCRAGGVDEGLTR